MAPLGGGAAEMAGQRCSTEAAGGASMGRWFQVRGGEIGAGVDAVENGGDLGTFYRAVGRRKAGGRAEGGGDSGTSVALVTGDGNGEAEVMVRWLHGAGGGWHSEERRDGRGGGQRRQRLAFGGRR
jgi:hypothetical protein